MFDEIPYQSYKPLRNYIRQLSLRESLYVIWAYVNYLQFHQAFPKDIEVSEQFLQAQHHYERHVYEWELETIAREIIINGENIQYGSKTLRYWNNFSSLINKLKDLENIISGHYYNSSNVVFEMFRIAHRQFPWQGVPSPQSIMRNYKIFTDPEVDKIIKLVTGFSARELIMLGTALLGHFLGSYFSPIPVTINIPGYTQSHATSFIDRFSLKLQDFQTAIKNERAINENFAYGNISLRKYPLIKIDNGGIEELFCPLPTLLFWRITGGLYYEACGKKGFDNAFGKSFEQYVGEVIAKAHTNKNFIAHGAQPYYVGKLHKDSIDWIIDEGSSAFFIESKTKRMNVVAKFNFNDHAKFEEELSTMADIIVQVYKSISDYQKNLYPHLPFDPKRKVFPMIITLEDWYLFLDEHKAKIEKAVIKKLEELSLPTIWLTETPYQICSIEDFEKLVQIIQTVGIGMFMKKRFADAEKQKWHLGQFMRTEFPDEFHKVKFLFLDDYDKLGGLKKTTMIPHQPTAI
jgi:hypothetical protein